MDQVPRFEPLRFHSHWIRVVLLVFFLCPVPTGQSPPLQAAPAPDDEPTVSTAADVGISIDQQLNFGQVADYEGSLAVGLEDAIVWDPTGISFGGSVFSGIYTITGDPDTAVDISITSPSGNGFNAHSFYCSEGSFPLIGTVLDGSGEKVIIVGATLYLNSSQASVGSGQNISVTITATYN